jgi:hypothetical protein
MIANTKQLRVMSDFHKQSVSMPIDEEGSYLYNIAKHVPT